MFETVRKATEGLPPEARPLNVAYPVEPLNMAPDTPLTIQVRGSASHRFDRALANSNAQNIHETVPYANRSRRPTGADGVA